MVQSFDEETFEFSVPAEFFSVVNKEPFKYYVIKKVGGWVRQNDYVWLQGGWVRQNAYVIIRIPEKNQIDRKAA